MMIKKVFNLLKSQLTVGLIFILITIIFTYPLVININDKIAGDGGDASLYISWQNIANNQLNTGVNPFGWTNKLRYPVGFNFSTSYDGVIFITLGFILYRFSTNPVFVYNFSLLILLYLNTLFSYIFFKRISSNTEIGILGSIVYSFSFYILARQYGHTNLIFIGCFPFFVYTLINLKEKKGNLSSFILFGLGITITFLSSLHYFILLTCSFVVLLFILIFVDKKIIVIFLNIFWLRRIYFILTTLCVFGLFIIFEGQHLVDLLNGVIRTFPAYYVTELSPHILNLLLPNSYSQTLVNKLPLPTVAANIENSLYLGIFELILFVIFIIHKGNRKIKILITSIFISFLLLTLGCQSLFGIPLPYCKLYSFFPFTTMAEAGRYYVILYLLLTTGIVILLKNFNNSIILTAIFIFIILERIPINFKLSDGQSNRPDIKIINNISSNAVFNLPIINMWRGDYNLLSIYYNKPIVGGAIQWLGENNNTQSFLNQFTLFNCGVTESLSNIDKSNKMMNLLKNNGIHILSIEKNIATETKGADYCDQARKNIFFFLNNSGISNTLIYDGDESSVFYLIW